MRSNGAESSGGTLQTPETGTCLNDGNNIGVLASAVAVESIPKMPTRKKGFGHRPGFGLALTQQLAVARSVSHKERRQVPEAAAATQKEWTNLVIKEAWDMKSVNGIF